MKPPRNYKKTDQKKEADERRRKGILQYLLNIESIENKTLTSILKGSLGSRGRADARWIRDDIRALLWKPEYDMYSQSQKAILAQLAGDVPPQPEDEAELETTEETGMTSPSDNTQEASQSEDSFSASPNLGTESKLRHIAMTFAFNEYVDMEKDSDKKAKTYRDVSVLDLLQHLSMFHRSVLDPKASNSLDLLINSKQNPRSEATMIPGSRVQWLMFILCGSIDEAIKESFVSRDPIIYSIGNLLTQTKDLCKRMDGLSAGEESGMLKIDDKEASSQKKYSFERIIRSIEFIINEL